eukprot:g5663.t1
MLRLCLASFLAASAAELYCPSAGDMNLEHGNVTFTDGGWEFLGDCRVSSKTSWNLLSGYISFDMDTSGVANEVNTNLYTSSPALPNCGEACYCDIQKSKSGKPSCMELDVIENNGQCAMATTLHTFATDGQPNNQNCDRWGCAAQVTHDGPRFSINATFGADGSVIITRNGKPNPPYAPSPSSDSDNVVVKTMQSIGAVLESSQWFGWAPAESSCPGGDQSGLAESRLKISNVRVSGAVVQGPAPTKCAPAAPTPPPQPTPAPPTPAPTPPPTPPPATKTCPSCDGGVCGCSWVAAGSCDGAGDGSCCFKCCCGK